MRKRRPRVSLTDIEFVAGQSSEQPVLKVQVRGVWVPVCVTAGGNFAATFGASREVAPTLAELREKLTRASRRRSVLVSIPAMLRGQKAFVPVILIGLHAATNALRFRYATPNNAGKTVTSSITDRHFNRKDIYRHVTPEEQAEFFRLEQERDKAEAAFRRFQGKLTIDGWKLTADAVGRATDKLAREEEG